MHQSKYILLFLFLIILASPTYCQYKSLNDQEIQKLTEQSIDSIYNLNFRAADASIAALEKKIPDYPGIMLLKAFYVSWKYRPIKKGQESFDLFESYLQKGIEQSEALLTQNENNMEANFFLLACHAYLAQLYSDNNMSLKALGEAKSAYKYIKVGFDYYEQYPEFYFSSGIYNYYREKYPQENPFYKSFMWFFRSGNMEEGLKMLNEGSQKATFTKAECFTYLFHINLRYEDKPQTAIYYAQILKDKYPNNMHYLANYVENKIRLNQFADLLPSVNRLLQSDNPYYRYIGEIFYGSYLENAETNLDQALAQYRKADAETGKKDLRIPHYDSILYLGMGRVYKIKGDKDMANQYLKQSIKTAQYSAYRKDAELLMVQ